VKFVAKKVTSVASHKAR